MPTERQIAYDNQVKSMFASYGTAMIEYDQRVVDLLIEVQEAISERIRRIPQEDWERLVFTEISQQVTEELQKFQDKYMQVMAESLDFSGESGIDVIIQPLRDSLDVSNMAFADQLFRPAVLDEVFQRMMGVSATLIKEASDQTAQNIINKIILGSVEDKQRFEVIEEIIGELDGNRLGFKTLNQRAWAIYRTESARMQAIAREMQMQQILQLFPKAQKVWYHGVMSGTVVSGGKEYEIGKGQTPRPGHVRLDGEHIPYNEQFINPVTNDQLRYPHDPLAPATEVINCGCAHTLYMPDDEFLKNDTLINV